MFSYGKQVSSITVYIKKKLKNILCYCAMLVNSIQDESFSTWSQMGRDKRPPSRHASQKTYKNEIWDIYTLYKKDPKNK